MRVKWLQEIKGQEVETSTLQHTKKRTLQRKTKHNGWISGIYRDRYNILRGLGDGQCETLETKIVHLKIENNEMEVVKYKFLNEA